MKPSGYSGTPRERKLGFKPEHRIAIIDAPEDFVGWVRTVPEAKGATFDLRRSRLDTVLVFAHSRRALMSRVDSARARMVATGSIWCCWPKRAPGVSTDITEDAVREIAFSNQLVDVKVCSVSEVWSGLKLMIRKADR